jgi:hypothetical protein
LLVIAGDQDPRSPLDQITAYLDLLAVPHDFYRHDSGHATTNVTELVSQAAAAVRFAAAVSGVPLNPDPG